MPSKSKIKGSAEERAVVQRLRELGFEAYRSLEDGKRNTGEVTFDVATDILGVIKKIECKLRAKGFATIYKYIEGVEALTIRADRKERLWVLPENILFKLLDDKETKNEL